MSSEKNLREPMFLLGYLMDDIIGNKLPSNEQVLKLLFHYTKNVKKTVHEGCQMTIEKVKKFWILAGIFILDDKRCVQKLQKLYDEYRNLNKNAGMPFNQKREQEFSIKLQSLFDIAHSKVFEMVNDEIKNFLIDQRSARQFHLNLVNQQENSTKLSGNSNKVLVI